MAEPKHKSKIPLYVALGLLLGGALFFFRPQHDGLLPEKFYRYYPATTQYYLELQTTQSPPSHLLKHLTRPTLFSKLLPLSLTRYLPPSLLTNRSIPALLPEDPALQTLLHRYPEFFKSSLALGGWKDKDPQAAPSFLMVLPLKDPTHASKLFPHTPSASTSHSNPSYWVSPTSGLSLSRQGGNLLIASSAQAMETALQQAKHLRPQLLEEKRYQPYLQKLATHRQGTFLLQTQQMLRKAGTEDSELKAQGLKRFEQLATLSPFLLGGIEEKPEHVTRINLYAPLDLTRIIQPSLQQDIKAWLSLAIPLQTSQYLPATTPAFVSISNLDKLWDLYSHLPRNKGLQTDLRAYQYLLNSVKIDLRKDLVDILSGEVSLSLPAPTSPMLLISNTRQKASTLNKVTQLLSLSIFPLQLKAEQINETPVQTLTLTKSFRGFRNLQVSYGTIDNMIAVGNSTVLQQLIENQHKPDTQLATSALYRLLSQQLPAQALAMGYFNFQSAGISTQPQAMALTVRMESPDCINATLAAKLPF